MKKKLLPLVYCLAFGVFAGMLLNSCSGNQPKEQAPAATENVAKDSNKVDQAEVSYNLPSPLQIAALFKKSGLKYIEGITNPQKNAGSYTSNFSKAINLGVYGTDLAYCVLNKQKQEAMSYMKLSTELSNSLGLTSVFKEGDFIKRFESNLNQEDSLRVIISEVQMATDTYLQDNDQQQVSAIAFSGAWIEAMYIGSNVFDKSKDKKLNEKISEQMGILNKIILVLKARESSDASITPLIADLNSLLTIYNGLESVKKSKVDTGVDDPGAPVLLTEQETGQLVKKIAELRTKFIKI